jgi:hypothetical protein
MGGGGDGHLPSTTRPGQVYARDGEEDSVAMMQRPDPEAGEEDGVLDPMHSQFRPLSHCHQMVSRILNPSEIMINHHHPSLLQGRLPAVGPLSSLAPTAFLHPHGTFYKWEISLRALADQSSLVCT